MKRLLLSCILLLFITGCISPSMGENPAQTPESIESKKEITGVIIFYGLLGLIIICYFISSIVDTIIRAYVVKVNSNSQSNQTQSKESFQISTERNNEDDSGNTYVETFLIYLRPTNQGIIEYSDSEIYFSEGLSAEDDEEMAQKSKKLLLDRFYYWLKQMGLSSLPKEDYELEQ